MWCSVVQEMCENSTTTVSLQTFDSLQPYVSIQTPDLKLTVASLECGRGPLSHRLLAKPLFAYHLFIVVVTNVVFVSVQAQNLTFAL